MNQVPLKTWKKKKKRKKNEGWNEFGDNSSPRFGRLAEAWRKFFWKTIGIRKNGKRRCTGRGIERDALFNREMRTCRSVREGRTTGGGGALKAQSGYNAGQGRKAAVSKPPPFRGSSARRDPLLFPARGGNYVSTFGWKKGREGMKSARFRKLLSDGILNRRSRLSLSEIILAHLFALYRLRILINRG